MNERMVPETSALYLNLVPDDAPSCLKEAQTEKSYFVTYCDVQVPPRAACPGNNVRTGMGEGSASVVV